MAPFNLALFSAHVWASGRQHLCNDRCCFDAASGQQPFGPQLYYAAYRPSEGNVAPQQAVSELEKTDRNVYRNDIK